MAPRLAVRGRLRSIEFGAGFPALLLYGKRIRDVSRQVGSAHSCVEPVEAVRAVPEPAGFIAVTDIDDRLREIRKENSLQNGRFTASPAGERKLKSGRPHATFAPTFL